MLGPHENTDDFQHVLRGVIPRSLDFLFKLIEEKAIYGDKFQFICKCSFLELYNEQIFDLLDSSTPILQLREDPEGGVFVEGVQEVVVSSADDAYQVLKRGLTNRTIMNHDSSRSDAIFTVAIESKLQVIRSGVWEIKTSQLRLVDLAGSEERPEDTNTTGHWLKEVGSINRSISGLGNVITALADIACGKTSHIPYRDSKLSYLLRDSLGGNSNTSIVACVHPGSKYFDESLSTLQFACRAKMIKNKAIINDDYHRSFVRFQMEVMRLKEAFIQRRQTSCSSANSTTMGVNRCLSPVRGTSDETYKSYFLQAMMLRNESEMEKKVIVENLKKQKELHSRKEDAMRQMMMLLKFCFDQMEMLRSEIKSQQTIIDHHPEVVRLKSENRNSEAEHQREAELERLFHELQTENGDLTRFETPQQQLQETSPSSSTARIESLDKLKSERDQLLLELDEIKSKLFKQQLEQETELEMMKCEVAYVDLRNQRLLFGREAE